MIYWEQRKLGEYLIQYTEVTIINDQYPVLTSSRKGIFFQKDYYDGNQIASENNIGYNIVPYGYFTYRHMSDDEIFYFNINNIIDNGIVSTLYPVFTTNNRLDSKFLQYELNFGKEFRKYSVLQKQGGSRTYMYFNKLRDLKLTITTSLKEQECIRNLICSIDNLITLHQSKSFGHILKAIVSCTLYWEQRKLGEVGKARSGIGFPESEQGGTIGTPFFKVSDMNIDGNENEMTAANNYVTTAQIVAHKWSPIEELPAIFFAKVGAAVMLNRKRLCRFPFLLDNNTMAYSLDKTKWDADFAKALFETVDLTSLVQVGALPSYNSGDIEAMEILLPSLSEQSQIGAFFKKIDHLITLHQLEPFQLIFKAIAYRIIDYAKSKPPRCRKYTGLIAFIKYYI